MVKRKQAQPSPSDVAQIWMLRQMRVSIAGIALLPQENIYLKGTPLVLARGQAQAFYLHDATGMAWILKKFLPGRNPDARYIQAIRALIPQHAGFESGYQRRVLDQASVAGSALPTPEFESWVENTILMPLVGESDWAYIADKVRDGTITLSPEQRLLMCRNLSEKVRVLESSNLSHRDLSSTNIFIDAKTWDVHLIDWDSIYHASLTIPANTTFGTNGYVAPFVRTGGAENPRATWMRGADRFSMAVLNVEFLSVEQNSPVTGDGGLLDQDEIYNRRGSGINNIADSLRRNFPSALGLFERALQANDFDDCPTPDEWMRLGAGVTAPSLKDIYDPRPDFQKFVHELQKATSPRRPAPDLSSVEGVNFSRLFTPATKDEGPPAPSLSNLEPVASEAFLSYVTPAIEPPSPAPRLDDVEDPSAGVNKSGGGGAA